MQNDTQLYLALSPNEFDPLESLYQCLSQVKVWISQNLLKLYRVIIFGKMEHRLCRSTGHKSF